MSSSFHKPTDNISRLNTFPVSLEISQSTSIDISYFRHLPLCHFLNFAKMLNLLPNFLKEFLFCHTPSFLDEARLVDYIQQVNKYL